eukprot:1161113-Pelagomonas_calceolata.AAC.3
MCAVIVAEVGQRQINLCSCNSCLQGSSIHICAGTGQGQINLWSDNTQNRAAVFSAPKVLGQLHWNRAAVTKDVLCKVQRPNVCSDIIVGCIMFPKFRHPPRLWVLLAAAAQVPQPGKEQVFLTSESAAPESPTIINFKDRTRCFTRHVVGAMSSSCAQLIPLHHVSNPITSHSVNQPFSPSHKPSPTRAQPIPLYPVHYNNTGAYSQ